MAITQDGRSILLTAQGDVVTGRKCLGSLVIQGTGMTPGAEFKITEADGNVISRGYITGDTDYMDTLPSTPWWVDGIKAEMLPAGARIHAFIV